MNRRPKLTPRPELLLLLLPLLPLLPGWTGSWQEIRQTASQMQAIRAEFVQSKHLPILTRPLVSEGTFSFRRPGDIRWEYSRPLQSILLMNKDEIRRYVRREGQLVPDASAQVEAMRVVLAEIGGWLAGRFEESSTFAPVLEPGTPARIVLTPKDPALARFITRIEIRLSATPGVIEEVKIFEGPEAYTVIEFRNPQLLPTLPDDLFRAAS